MEAQLVRIEWKIDTLNIRLDQVKQQQEKLEGRMDVIQPRVEKHGVWWSLIWGALAGILSLIIFVWKVITQKIIDNAISRMESRLNGVADSGGGV